jgi:hypothetical protein
MKFKVLCISFNIVLFLSFLTVFLLPVFIFDGSFMAEFWTKNWYFGLIFLVILVAVNSVFVAYWRTIGYLEKEDWPGLSQYLETQVFVKKRYSYRKLSLLCDSLLLLGDTETLKKLEDTLRTERPKLLARLGVRFSSASLVTADYSRLRALVAELADAKGADRDWLRFHAAFADLVEKKYDAAAGAYIGLAAGASEPLIVGLCGYISARVLPGKVPSLSDSLSATAKSCRERVLAKFGAKKWASYVEDAKAGMHVVVLGKMLDETGLWLFPGTN